MASNMQLHKLDFEKAVKDGRGSISISLKRGSVCAYNSDGRLLLSNKELMLECKLQSQICVYHRYDDGGTEEQYKVLKVRVLSNGKGGWPKQVSIDPF